MLSSLQKAKEKLKCVLISVWLVEINRFLHFFYCFMGTTAYLELPVFGFNWFSIRVSLK